MDIRGKIVLSDDRKVSAGQNRISCKVSILKTGIYLGVFTDSNNGLIIKKIIKK